MKQFQNILIVRTDRIGDVVLTTPVIESLRNNFPNAKISILISGATRDLVDGNPFLDEVIIDNRQGRLKGFWRFWGLLLQIKRRKFDVAFIFHTKKRTNLLCFLAGIPERVGYKDKHYGFLLTKGFEDRRHFGEKHEVEYCLDILRKMGMTVNIPKIYLPEKQHNKQWAQQWISKNNPSGLKIVAIHPGASDSTKTWPVANFVELIDQLIFSLKCCVIVIGADNAKELAHQLRGQCKNPFIDLTGQTTVGQTVSLLKECDLLISNDSGPMHLGAAAGIYVIALFLRNQPGINPERWKPYGSKGYVLSNLPEEAIRLGHNSQITSGIKDSIKAEEILLLAKELLNR